MVQPYVAQDIGGFGRALQAKFKREEIDERKKSNAFTRTVQEKQLGIQEKKFRMEQDLYKREEESRYKLQGWLRSKGASDEVVSMAIANPKWSMDMYKMSGEDQEKEIAKIKMGYNMWVKLEAQMKANGTTIQENYPAVRDAMRRIRLDVPDEYDEQMVKTALFMGRALMDFEADDDEKGMKTKLYHPGTNKSIDVTRGTPFYNKAIEQGYTEGKPKGFDKAGGKENKKLEQLHDNYYKLIGRADQAKRGVGEYLPNTNKQEVAKDNLDRALIIAKQYADAGGDIKDLGINLEEKPKSKSKMPTASEHKGKIIKDIETGKRYKSNGSKWEEI